MAGKPRLTPQNVAFLDFYRSDPEFRYARNYMKAYPACKTVEAAKAASCRLLGKPVAQDYLQKKGAKAAEAVDLQEEDILRDLMEVRDKCMGREEAPFVKVTKDGDIIEGDARDFNANGATKSLELLGKNKKMFTDKVEQTGRMEVEFNFDFTGDKEDED